MIEFVPYLPHHLEQLKLQQAQAYLQPQLANPVYRQALKTGLAITGLNDGHQVAGASGIMPVYPGRAIAWCLFSEKIVPIYEWPCIIRTIRGFLDLWQKDPAFERIEAVVEDGFAKASRMVTMLGFEFEGPMRKFKDGKTFNLYARIR